MNYSSEEDGGGVTPEDVKRFLQSELSPEAFQRVEQMLQALCDQEAGNENGEGDLEEDYQQDQPPPDGFSGIPNAAKGRQYSDSDRERGAIGRTGFIGEFGAEGEDATPTQPRTGRTLPRTGAQDAAYYRRFPQARRIQHAFDAGEARPAPVASSAAYASYAARWPDARRIRVMP